MTIWHYLVCEFDRKAFHVVGKQKEPEGAYDIHDLGVKGWELISISGWQLDRAIALFKRPDPTARAKRT